MPLCQPNHNFPAWESTYIFPFVVISKTHQLAIWYTTLSWIRRGGISQWSIINSQIHKVSAAIWNMIKTVNEVLSFLLLCGLLTSFHWEWNAINLTFHLKNQAASKEFVKQFLSYLRALGDAKKCLMHNYCCCNSYQSKASLWAKTRTANVIDVLWLRESNVSILNGNLGACRPCHSVPCNFGHQSQF